MAQPTVLTGRGNDPARVDARPTKQFFITMLVRDIELIRAIIDLIDNCVDGARRLRPTGDFEGLFVRLETTKQHFKIDDNCGGIPLDIAREYAFRFGRPRGTPETRHSVGQFGVGMKRALFKLGRHFCVESATATSRFTIDEDVDEWQTTDDWQFRMTHLEENAKVPTNERGTRILVDKLNPVVAESFALDNFLSRLREQVEMAHQLQMSRGLSVTINGAKLRALIPKLLQSEQIKPAYRETSISEKGKKPVSVAIYAGLAESSPALAGWYVFCNGRSVLEADQTHITGWGEGSGSLLPKYHPEFARFRGYVFFDSDDAGQLPWNTTKTGIDSDSPIYRGVRMMMIEMTRPVIDFLNRLSSEKKTPEQDRRIEPILEKAKEVALSAVKPVEVFRAPVVQPPKPKPAEARITYWRPMKDVSAVQKALRVTTYKEVGEKTFDYFVKQELPN